jgi:hypothetical protein
MKSFIKPLVIAVASTSFTFSFSTAALDANEFVNPPAESKPRLWWHWMAGNVTSDGIAKDLAWMKQAGVGGLQNFDAELYAPQIIDKRVNYMSPEWQSLFSQAVNTATEFGIEYGIAASPGWSETGGPWVEPKDGLKKLVWREQDVVSGQADINISAAENKSGIYKDFGALPSFGASHGADIPESFYADVAVFAYPIDDQAKSFAPDRISASSPIDLSKLQDGSLAQGQSLIAEAKGGSAWMILHYDQSVTVSTVTLGFEPMAQFMGAKAIGTLEVSTDGETFAPLMEFPSVMLPETTVTFEPVTVRALKIRFDSNAKPFALPGDPAPGVDAALPRAQAPERLAMDLFEVRVSNESRVHRFEEKAGFSVAEDYYSLGQGRQTKGIAPDDVIDLSGLMDAEGNIDWSVPEGKWRIVRLGYTLVGTKNHPAVPEATGLEVDKYDAEAVRRYINTYMDKYASAIGDDKMGAAGLSNILNDSIESGASNWTPAMFNEFKKYRGYSMKPWLPVLTGAVVGDSTKSEAFLFDFRRTLADLIADNHYAVITEELHKRGIKHYSEALESGRPVLGDDLAMRKTADIPMAAMWTFNTDKSIGPRPQYWADIRGAASVAHVYGKEQVAAESLTSAVAPWAFSPRDFQPMIDMEFALGVTRPVLHSSVHQPVDDYLPGMSLWIFGHYFNRHDTWAPYANYWVDYLARNAYMLNQGRFVADVAYFFGEEAPLTALYNDEPHMDVPRNNGFDYINADMLFNALSAKNGFLESEAGARYRAVFLGGTSERMTVAVLKQLLVLANNGVKIIGQRPYASPSLTDDNAEFEKLVDQLWSKANLGRVVFDTRHLQHGLTVAGIESDFEANGAADSQIFFVHRSLEAKDIYFYTNRLNRVEPISFAFRSKGKKPMLWDAQSGKTHELGYRIEGEYTVIDRELRPFESAYIVFDEDTSTKSFSPTARHQMPVAQYDSNWQVSFVPKNAAKTFERVLSVGDWSNSSDMDIKYFSGTADYQRVINLPASSIDDSHALYLDLGEVREMAEVSINGKTVDLLWKPPYRVNIKPYVNVGENQLSVKVTNLWVNRLIGDVQPGVVRTTAKPIAAYSPDAPLRVSGLMGPVRIVVEH